MPSQCSRSARDQGVPNKYTAGPKLVEWTTMLWLPGREPTAHADQDIRERYAAAIALWDTSRNLDSRGLSLEQRKRWLQYIAAVNGEISFEHAAFWHWLLKNGRVQL